MLKKHIKNKGFSLLELMIVVSILSIILAISVVNYRIFLIQFSVNQAAEEATIALRTAQQKAITLGMKSGIYIYSKTEYWVFAEPMSMADLISYNNSLPLPREAPSDSDILWKVKLENTQIEWPEVKCAIYSTPETKANEIEPWNITTVYIYPSIVRAQTVMIFSGGNKIFGIRYKDVFVDFNGKFMAVEHNTPGGPIAYDPDTGKYVYAQSSGPYMPDSDLIPAVTPYYLTNNISLPGMPGGPPVSSPVSNIPTGQQTGHGTSYAPPGNFNTTPNIPEDVVTAINNLIDTNPNSSGALAIAQGVINLINNLTGPGADALKLAVSFAIQCYTDGFCEDDVGQLIDILRSFGFTGTMIGGPLGGYVGGYIGSGTTPVTTTTTYYENGNVVSVSVTVLNSDGTTYTNTAGSGSNNQPQSQASPGAPYNGLTDSAGNAILSGINMSPLPVTSGQPKMNSIELANQNRPGGPGAGYDLVYDANGELTSGKFSYLDAIITYTLNPDGTVSARSNPVSQQPQSQASPGAPYNGHTDPFGNAILPGITNIPQIPSGNPMPYPTQKPMPQTTVSPIPQQPISQPSVSPMPPQSTPQPYIPFHMNLAPQPRNVPLESK